MFVVKLEICHIVVQEMGNDCKAHAPGHHYPVSLVPRNSLFLAFFAWNLTSFSCLGFSQAQAPAWCPVSPNS